MQQLPLPIGQTERVGDNADYRDSLMVNYTFVDKKIKGFPIYIVSHPGIESFSTGEGVDRGGVYNPRINAHLRLSGTRLISIDESGVSNVIGIIPGTRQASLHYSFQTQGILSANRFWLYDGTTLNEVSDPDLGAPIAF